MSAEKKSPAKKKAPVKKQETAVINVEVTKKAVLKLNGVNLTVTKGSQGVQIHGDSPLDIRLENDRCFEVYER